LLDEFDPSAKTRIENIIILRKIIYEGAGCLILGGWWGTGARGRSEIEPWIDCFSYVISLKHDICQRLVEVS